jgi:magnesium transporter
LRPKGGGSMEEENQKKPAEQNEEPKTISQPEQPSEPEVDLKPDVFISPEVDEAEESADFHTLLDLIHNKKALDLREFIASKDPIDIAYIVNDIKDDSDVVYLFKSVPNKYTADIFSYLDQKQQEKIVQAFSSKDVQAFIAQMPNDDIADFVEELPSNLISKVLQSTSPDDRSEINSLLNYKANTAGSIMTTEYVSIKSGATCGEAMKKIKTTGREAETVVITYVVDATRKLIGALSLEDLLFADESMKIDDIMDADCISCIADTDQEDVASLMKKYDLTVIPVIDKEQRMLGIITIDDVMDVIEAEQTEDLAKMAAVTPIEGDYLKTSVFKLALSRIPWLSILLICDTFSGMLINSYETLISSIPVLSAFIPVLMDTGGNAGGQTTTVVTRAMSLGQINGKDWMKVIWKEMRVSLIVGTAVTLINFGWIYAEFAMHFIDNNSTYPEWQIALLVAITGFIIIVMSKTIGAALPLLAKRMHIDPAIMAGPLITSIVDTSSLAVYFALVRAILKV